MTLEQAFDTIDKALSRKADNGEIDEAWALRGLLDFIQEQVTGEPVEGDRYDRNYREARGAAEDLSIFQ